MGSLLNEKGASDDAETPLLYPEPRPIYEVLSSHSARKAFASNMYKNVKDPNLVCALTGHKEGSKAFNRYRMIDEDTNRKTMSYLE